MNTNGNQPPFQSHGYPPPAVYGPGPALSAYTPDAIQAGINPQFLAGAQPASPGQQPVGAQGLVSLVGLSLRALEEINAVAARALDQAQAADIRQSLWQIQQLASQVRSFQYQARGMLLQ